MDTMTEKEQALYDNDYNWYVVDLIEGGWDLKHETALSSILQCGHAPEDYGYAAVNQCWNHEDLR